MRKRMSNLQLAIQMYRKMERSSPTARADLVALQVTPMRMMNPDQMMRLVQMDLSQVMGVLNRTDRWPGPKKKRKKTVKLVGMSLPVPGLRMTLTRTTEKSQLTVKDRRPPNVEMVIARNGKPTQGTPLLVSLNLVIVLMARLKADPVKNQSWIAPRLAREARL
jgi:hypothetical protein